MSSTESGANPARGHTQRQDRDAAEPGRAKREPGGAKREPGGAKREPGGAKREPGGAKRERGGPDTDSPGIESPDRGRADLSARTWRGVAFEDAPAQIVQDTLLNLFGLSASALVPLVEAIDVVSRRELWKVDGARTLVSWIIGQFQVSAPTASALVAVAEGLRSLPCLKDAMRRGRFSLDQMRHIVRFATSETDADLADDCQSRGVHELAQMASEANPADDDRVDDHWGQRSFQRHQHRNGMVSHTITLPADAAELVSESVDEVAGRIPKNPETDMYDPLQQRRADAFVAIYSDALGDGERPTTTVNVHVDGAILFDHGTNSENDTNRDNQPNDRHDRHGTDDQPARPPHRPRRRYGRCGFASGTQVARREIDKLLCTSRIRIVPETDDGVPVKVNGATRNFPKSVRRHIERRDQVCRFPGCGNDFALDGHHVVHVPHGGPTDVHNCCCLCKYHHHFTHKNGWRVEGDAETQLTFVRPNGAPLVSPRAPLPDNALERLADVVDGIRRRHLANIPLDRSRLVRRLSNRQAAPSP